jgi:mono/diheme cytochrome c family protein
MPVVSLTDADIKALAVYLRSLGPGAKIPVLVLPRPMQGVTTPSVVEGKVLYRAVACQSCHMIGGQGVPVGPSLDSYGISGRKQNGLVLFFRDPDRVVPGSIMPVLHGTDRQLRSLALYMLSLKTRITPTAALGRKIYAQRNCGYCHGRSAEGLPLGPRLTSRPRNRTDAWLLEHFLAPALVAGRETMPRVWASDWELQSLLEYLKTLQTQASPPRRGAGA